jgi:hypothetical protein
MTSARTASSKPPPKHKALNGGNRRDREALETVERHHVAFEQRPQLAGAQVRPRHNVTAKAEIRPFGMQEHGARFAVSDHIESPVELVEHLRRQPVLRGIGEGDRRERIFDRIAQMGHGETSWLSG